MADRIPTVGLDDIAWGIGTTTVPTYGGGTRPVKRVNLASIPYNDTKTVGEALDEFNNLLQSQKYSDIHDNLEAILKVINNISHINQVYLNLGQLRALKEDLNTIINVANNLEVLKSIPTELEFIDRAVKDTNYYKNKFERLLERTKKEVYCQNVWINGKLSELSEQNEATRQDLDTIISTAKQEVQTGNELVAKFGTYALEIQAKPYCREPKFIVDDINERLIWQVPTVKGDCRYSEVTSAQVQDVVDAYLDTFPSIGSGGSLDEPVTQEEVNQAIVDYFNGGDGNSIIVGTDEAMTQEEVCQAVGVDCAVQPLIETSTFTNLDSWNLLGSPRSIINSDGDIVINGDGNWLSGVEYKNTFDITKKYVLEFDLKQSLVGGPWNYLMAGFTDVKTVDKPDLGAHYKVGVFIDGGQANNNYDKGSYPIDKTIDGSEHLAINDGELHNYKIAYDGSTGDYTLSMDDVILLTDNILLTGSELYILISGRGNHSLMSSIKLTTID